MAAAPNALRSEISRLIPQRVGLERLSDRATAAVGTARERGQRGLARSASSTLAQTFAPRNTGFAGALSDATRRQRIRSDIVGRGDKAIAQQQLQDRVAIARRGRGRQGALTSSLGAAANVRSGVNIGLSDARAFESASRADLLGGAAGSLGAAFIGSDTGKRLSSQAGTFLKGLFS